MKHGDFGCSNGCFDGETMVETHHFHHPKDLPQTPANDHPPCRVSVGILVSGDGCSTGFYGNFIGEKRGNLHGGVLKWRYP